MAVAADLVVVVVAAAEVEEEAVAAAAEVDTAFKLTRTDCGSKVSESHFIFYRKLSLFPNE